MKLKQLLGIVDGTRLDVTVCESDTKAPMVTIHNPVLCDEDHEHTFKRLWDAEVIDLFDVSLVGSAKHGSISVTVDLPDGED